MISRKTTIAVVAERMLAGLMALLIGACATTRSDTPSIPDVEHLNDSGKRLQGDYAVTAVEDSYRRQAPGSSLIFSFDDQGRVKKQDTSSQYDGTYLIDTSGTLFIFIEKVNGEALTGARVESYVIEEQGEDHLSLVRSSRKYVLSRR